MEGDPATGTPPHIDLWRSVRAGGDVKTRTSAPGPGPAGVYALGALYEHRERQKTAGLWSADGLVFCTRNGGVLDAANVRRSFKRV